MAKGIAKITHMITNRNMNPNTFQKYLYPTLKYSQSLCGESGQNTANLQKPKEKIIGTITNKKGIGIVISLATINALGLSELNNGVIIDSEV